MLLIGLKLSSTSQKHYPDLGSDVSSEYGISALVSQTSFGGKTTGGVAKCRLFSQATTKFKCAKKKTNEKQMLPCEGTAENFPFEWPQFRSRHQKIEQYFV